MAQNRVTEGMKRWHKRMFLFRFIQRGGYTRYERNQNRSFSMRVVGLLPTLRKSWKGPTSFVPRCGKHVFVDGKHTVCTVIVKKDMQRCNEHCEAVANA